VRLEQITIPVAPGVMRASVVVVLSRRNLLTLLAKLDDRPKGSTKQIAKAEFIGDVVIKAEEDDTHYKGRKPGRMHHETEIAIAEGIIP